MRVLARDCRAFVPYDIYSRKRRRAKGSASVKRFLRQFQARKSGICYASALCFAVRLELLGAKTSSQDSNADTKIMGAAQSGLLMRTVATESVSLCERLKS